MGYNREKAVEYANKWALGRNPQYYNFDGQGGDCTNFVSQCLYAGYGEMNYAKNVGWFYISPSNRAAAWSGVEFLHKFLVNNKGAGPRAVEPSIEQAASGDIIQLSFDGVTFGHSLLVVETASEILISAHSDNSLRRPLASYNYSKARLLHII